MRPPYWTVISPATICRPAGDAAPARRHLPPAWPTASAPGTVYFNVQMLAVQGSGLTGRSGEGFP